jgi:diguanylate cyclase (GGDEF)-like protein
MTDIDHFKSINDTFGHQAGDEAIITVANLLKQMCRAGDLVARYGGEEFAVLCADCTAESATARADQIRKKLSETPHANLGNRRLTASFGVAQLQPGDSAETMLGRADRALLMAKEQGRNRVVQLGAAMDREQPRPRKWWSFGSLKPQPLVEAALTTEVPINIAIEKLRGFVSDQKARVISIRDNSVEMEISSEHMGLHRRQSDRPSMFRIELAFSEQRTERTNSFGLAAGSYSETIAKVVVRPKRRRDRRTDDQADRARLIMQSLKAYLMAKEVDVERDATSEQLVDAK